MSTVVVKPHPLLRHRLDLVCMKQTDPFLLRELLNELGYLMLFEGTRGLRTRPVAIATPLMPSTAEWLEGNGGDVYSPRWPGHVGWLLASHPLGQMGCLGIYPDHQTLLAVEYCCKVPESEGSQAFMFDPTLAKGGTAVAAATAPKARGATSIRLLCLLAAPERGATPCGPPTRTWRY